MNQNIKGNSSMTITEYYQIILDGIIKTDTKYFWGKKLKNVINIVRNNINLSVKYLLNKLII